MADNYQERTEQPTSRRREEAKAEGHVAVSKEFGTLLIILGGVIVFYFASVWIMNGITEFMKAILTSIDTEITREQLPELALTVVYNFFLILLPVFFIPLCGALAYVIQNGFNFSENTIKPRVERINPKAGFKRIFSVDSFSELFKFLLKVSIISYVAYVAVAKEWQNLPFLIDMEVGFSIIYIATVTFKIMVKTVWVLVAITIIDYAFQRWRHEKSLRMTRAEVEEEDRHTEGDPLVRARIRGMQRELARKRMTPEVPTDAVVITSPAQLAVALKYDSKKGSAPIVVAKGTGLVAENIKELAWEQGVPVFENSHLAKSLFINVEIGREIPMTHYKAVAEILANVYWPKNRARH